MNSEGQVGGHSIVSEHSTWKRVVSALEEIYEYIQDGGDKTI